MENWLKALIAGACAVIICFGVAALGYASWYATDSAIAWQQNRQEMAKVAAQKKFNDCRENMTEYTKRLTGSWVQNRDSDDLLGLKLQICADYYADEIPGITAANVKALEKARANAPKP